MKKRYKKILLNIKLPIVEDSQGCHILASQLRPCIKKFLPKKIIVEKFITQLSLSKDWAPFLLAHLTSFNFLEIYKSCLEKSFNSLKLNEFTDLGFTVKELTLIKNIYENKK